MQEIRRLVMQDTSRYAGHPSLCRRSAVPGAYSPQFEAPKHRFSCTTQHLLHNGMRLRHRHRAA